jgi:hypothetical protein
MRCSAGWICRSSAGSVPRAALRNCRCRSRPSCGRRSCLSCLRLLPSGGCARGASAGAPPSVVLCVLGCPERWRARVCVHASVGARRSDSGNIGQPCLPAS